MSENEIIAKYKRNGCKNEQIKIIADLNGVPYDAIKDILKRQGAMNRKIDPTPECNEMEHKRTRKQYAAVTSRLEEKILDLQKRGYTQKQIALECNVTTKTVHKLYVKHNIKCRNSGKLTDVVDHTDNDAISASPSLHASELGPYSNYNCDELLGEVLHRINSKKTEWRTERRFIQLCKDVIIRIFKELEI